MRTPALVLLAASILPVPVGAQHDAAAAVTGEHVLVGRYHFEDKEFAIDVNLNADGTALYSVGGSGGIRAEGFWAVREGRIHIFNKPGPVRLEPAGVPIRDARVALRVVARLPDGSPAQGLAVTWPNATGLFYMSDGRNETPLEDGPVAGDVTIEREADHKVLAAFAMAPGAPNDRRFTYHPSDVEPFDLEAMALDPRADVLEVEVGIASAMLHRVRD